jgi:ABC-type sugar transport system permease subunit
LIEIRLTFWAVDAGSLIEAYRHKTDDELLALAAARDALVPEAQDILTKEFQRRNLIVPRPARRVHSENTPDLEKNPAFHTTAKVGGILATIFVIGTAAGFVILAVTLDPDWKRNLFVSVVALLVVVGPFFAVIRWATWRNLRKARSVAKH